MTKVKIRLKPLKDGKRAALRLDYYPPILHPESGKLIRFQNIGLYIYIGKNLTALERQHNQVTKRQAEQIRSERQLYIANSQLDFLKRRNKDCFIQYAEDFAATKAGSTKHTYEAAIKLFKQFNEHKPLPFAHLSVAVVERFLDFLKKQDIEPNTVWLYYSKIKAVLKQAYKQDIISVDMPAKVKSAQKIETIKEYLTLPELKQLYETPCKHDDLKRACIFSALTGFAIGDLLKLTYKDLGKDETGAPVISARRKKSKVVVINPISEQAAEIAGSGNPDDRVFSFKYSSLKLKQLKAWVKSAGIAKNVTFHTFRHTFATMQLAAGTDITTVSNLLGHTNINQTMVYAKIVNEAKKQAAERIKL